MIVQHIDTEIPQAVRDLIADRGLLSETQSLAFVKTVVACVVDEAIKGAALLTGSRSTSKASLARVLRVNRSTVSRWRRGVHPRGVHLDRLWILANYWNDHLERTNDTREQLGLDVGLILGDVRPIGISVPCVNKLGQDEVPPKEELDV